MGRLKLILLCSALTFFLSCEEERLFINCSECDSTIPETAELRIKLENLKYTPAKEIEIYEGNFEDNILFVTLKTGSNEASVDVPVNRKYTIVARYTLSDGENCIAIDSAYPRVAYDEEQCDNPCYFTYDKSVNLRLIYD